MKQFAAFLIILMPLLPLKAQELLHSAPSLGGSNAEISFAEESHDFGKLKQHEKVVYEFSFKNTGREPLIITKAEGSCDCTVPEYPKHPIRPGETAKLKVEYDAKSLGTFHKSVKISSNARNAPIKEITINGSVVAGDKK